MSDVFGLDSHERIGHSWIILGLNHSKYYFSEESTKFDRPKARIAHSMKFHSAVFENKWWLSGWFWGKSQAIKEQSGLVLSPSQVYKIIMIPHPQHAETDSRLPQWRNESRAVFWKCFLYHMVISNGSQFLDLWILINFQIYHFLLEKSPFFCNGREWSFLIKTIMPLNSKVMSLHLSYQKYSIFLILTTMSDVFGLDSHERIGHSWIILGLNHSKCYFCQESTKFDRPKAPIAHPMRFHSAVFQNERWLSGLFRGKSQATK
jgi:hypothetical protein